MTSTNTATPGPSTRPKKPNYNFIHANPLPLTIQALPPLIPHNPLSLLQIIYTYVFHRQSCLPEPLYIAQFNESTRTVHVTDPRSILAFWNNGFFGKGSLSRSEPTWLPRRRRALGLIGKDEDLTAEELTERRRRERREFKAERARAEKERIAKQLQEEGKLEGPLGIEIPGTQGETRAATSVHFAPSPTEPEEVVRIEPVLSKEDVENLEHLQLTLEEAFFLVFGLGVLKIVGPDQKPIDTKEMFHMFRQHSAFPALPKDAPMQPDDTFMLNYVVYHHFRSLGWVVRSGVKFGVDYLLYNRGPVFTHAEFGLLIMPSYSDPYWATDSKRKASERKQWHWLHCANRVSSQVKKTIILVYVDIPPPSTEGEGSISAQLSRYRIREFSMRRWLVSRNRD